MRRRVVITGMGVICSAGTDPAAFTDKISRGNACFSPIGDERIDHLVAQVAGKISGFDSSLVPAELAAHDKIVHYAWYALDQALRMALVDPSRLTRRCALLFATCSGPMQTIEAHYERIANGDESISERELLEKRYYAPALFLADHFGIEGLATTVVTACSASAGAMGLGADLIRMGMADVVLAGGADTLAASTIAGFDGLKATSSMHGAPFSTPTGLVLGEGAGFMVLESEQHATGRNAEVLGEFLGYGLSNDAYHATAPDPSGKGQALAMTRALRDAGVDAVEISYVNAHGTGTEANDRAETRAIRRVFDQHVDALPVSSTKSMVGHCLGAAGVIEAIASFTCSQKGVLPPTANFTAPREGCTLDYVGTPGRPWGGNSPFMSNNFAFGGNNASLVFSRGRRESGAVSERSYAGDISVSSTGILSPAGLGRAALVDALRNRMATVREEPVHGDQHFHVGRVPEFDMRSIDRKLDTRGLDRSSILALAATRIALREAGIPDRPSALRDLGYYLSLSAGPSWGESEHLRSWFDHNYHLDQVRAFPYVVQNSVAGNVCRVLGLSGHNTTLCGGPGAGLMGIALAFLSIRNGHASSVLCGAVDELSERILGDSKSAGLHKCQVPAEASATVLLETAPTVRERAGETMGIVRGVAMGTAGGRDDGLVLESVIQEVLDEAETGLDDIGILCYDGPSGWHCSSMSVLRDDNEVVMIDCEGTVGCAEATSPLLNLAIALDQPRRAGDRGHVLAVAYWPGGFTGAVLIERPV